MATQHEVIKRFMHSLDTTVKSGTKAIDDAIVACSSGKFSSLQHLIDSIVKDVFSYQSKKLEANVFLKNKCGIILDNEDTGSIIGSDAGGKISYTVKTIVNESNRKLEYPTSSSTNINGLNFIWPDKKTLSKSEQSIVARLHTWWGKGALDLIEKSYGLSFKDGKTVAKDIEVRFYNADDGYMATAGGLTIASDHTAGKLVLNINMKYCEPDYLDDKKGVAMYGTLLDGMFVHELVHATIAATVPYFTEMPHLFVESLPELVRGLDRDAERILSLINDPTKLKKSLIAPDDGAYETDAGYILLRYLAKQSATTLPDLKFQNGMSWNNDKSSVVLSSQYTQSIFDASSYSKLKTIDASSTNKNMTLRGNKLANIIEASAAGSTMRGMGGNDIIYAGAGVDTIEIASGDGTDTIYGFSENDKLKIYSGTLSSISVSNTGNDIIVTAGNSKAILKQAANHIIQIVDNLGKTTKYVLGNKDKENTFIWKSGINYIGSDKIDTLKITTNNTTVDLRSTKQYQSIDILDVSSVKGKANIYLGKQNLKLTANDVLDYRIVNGKGVITTDTADIILNDYNKGTVIINGRTYAATNINNDLVWNSSKSTVYIYDNYITDKTNENRAYFSAFKSVKTIDATNKGWYLEINGNENNNIIKYGSSNGAIYGLGGDDIIYLNNSYAYSVVLIEGGEGNDTIYLGKGNDTILWWSSFDYEKGTDTIYNFDPLKDTIETGLNQKQASDTLKFYLLGKDVILENKYNDNLLILKNPNITQTKKYLSGIGAKYVSNAPGLSFSSNNTKVKITSSYKPSYFLAEYYSKAIEIDATTYNKKYDIVGNSLNNVIKVSNFGGKVSGGKGNDKIYAGAGADIIQYAKGDGNDTIYNFANNDKIKFTSDSLKSIAAASTGNDVVLTTANGGKMTLKAATGKIINVVNSAGTTTKYVLGRNDANNTFTWASGVRFIGTGKTDTLNVNTAGGTVDLTNTTMYKSIDAVNASKATKAVTIKGGAQAVNITGSNYNDTIKAGSKGGTITGGKGNDTITAGAGTDTIVIADGMGTDTITGFTASDKIKVASASYTLSASGSDVVVTAGTGKAVIKSGVGKNIQVVDKNGTTTKYIVGKKDSANTFTWANGMNYVGSSKTDTVNVNTGGANADLSKSVSINNINASKATKAVTIKGGAFVSTITGSAYADKITAGSKGDTIRAGKGNDTIYAGAGTDTIQYAKGEGSDTIYNLSSSDKIKFVSDSLKSIAAASTGTDVVITTANGGKMTLKAATGKTLNVVNSAGSTTKYVLGRNDANNTFTWASGVRFVGTGKTDTLNVNTAGGTVDLTNTTLYKSIDAVNASKATKAVTIKGGAQRVNITGSAYADTLTGANVAGGTVSGGAGNDTIKAGTKGGTLIGGKGNDKIYAGAGADIIKFAAGDGNDTVYNFSNSKDTIRLTSGSVTSYTISNGNGVIKTNNGTITLSGYTGSSVYVTGADGKKISYKAGAKSYQSTLGCLASSVSDNAASGTVNTGNLSQITPIGTVMVPNVNQSNTSSLQKFYGQK